MQITDFNVNVTSEDPDRLIAFYRDVVGLPKHPDIPEGGAFRVGNVSFFVDGHSETKGGTKEPQRVLLNFMVQDLATEQRRLEGHGVRFIRTAGREEWGGVISTFADPDGNYAQLMEYQG